MHPGKPTILAVCGGKPVFGLPGNPVAVMVTFLAFVRPALLRMMGSTRTAPPLPENPYRRFFTRTPTFEALVRRARSAQKAQPGQPEKL